MKRSKRKWSVKYMPTKGFVWVLTKYGNMVQCTYDGNRFHVVGKLYSFSYHEISEWAFTTRELIKNMTLSKLNIDGRLLYGKQQEKALSMAKGEKQ